MNYFKYLVGLFGVMYFAVSAFGAPDPKLLNLNHAYRLYIFTGDLNLEVIQGHITKTLRLNALDSRMLQAAVNSTYFDAFKSHAPQILKSFKQIKMSTLKKFPHLPLYIQCFSDRKDVQDIYIMFFSKADYLRSLKKDRDAIPKSVILMFSLMPSPLFLRGLNKPQHISLQEHYRELALKLREDIKSYIEWPEIDQDYVDAVLYKELLKFLKVLPKSEYFIECSGLDRARNKNKIK